jgi:hypothetical protein
MDSSVAQAPFAARAISFISRFVMLTIDRMAGAEWNASASSARPSSSRQGTSFMGRLRA